eukprot:scaffold34049_cov71-Cyclotella_meneghiniana.AAC.3
MSNIFIRDLRSALPRFAYYVEDVDQILDSQRRFQAMLADVDVFYSRTDLRMLIDQKRNEARTKLLGYYYEARGDNLDAETLPNLVLHAAAWLKVSPLNTMQLINDYPDLVRYQDGLNGSMPLHIAVKAVGGNHLERVKPFLDEYTQAVKLLDEHGLLPLHSALIYGAGYEVINLLMRSYIDAVKFTIRPRSNAPVQCAPYIGMLPFHVACCQSSPDVIYTFLLDDPEYLLNARF